MSESNFSNGDWRDMSLYGGLSVTATRGCEKSGKVTNSFQSIVDLGN